MHAASATATRGRLGYSAHPRITPGTSLDHLWPVADMLKALHAAGTEEAATALATRAVGHASLDNPYFGAHLLKALREAAYFVAGDAVHTRLSRHPADYVGFRNPLASAWTLRDLRAVEAYDAVTTLATRAADQASLENPLAAHELLGRCAREP